MWQRLWNRRWEDARDAAPAVWLFLRALAVVWLIAWSSLLVQLPGLFGSGGILPIRSSLESLSSLSASVRWLNAPTLFYLGASDAALTGACVVGLLASALLLFDVAPRACLLVLWALYLSFMSVGDVFLGYQWDTLLLETTFTAFLLAHGGLKPRARAVPHPVALFLGRFLLFRLMLLSGLVKLTSGDPTWSHLKALRFHFWTQPLPSPLGYYAAALPPKVQDVMCLLTLGLELALPLLIFAPRWGRRVAFAGLVALQLGIAATGSYGFFNLLTLCLCLLLLPGRDARRWRFWRRVSEDASAEPEPSRAAAVTWGSLLVIVTLATTSQSVERIAGKPLPATAALLRATQPLYLFGSYGLFAVMTTTRDEIEVSGSEDGLVWKPYVFRYKPGALGKLPRWAAPHQPRLDWQMWFAALQSCQTSEWFLAFAEKLLEGAPAVSKLLEHDPFAAHPPRYLQSTRWRYTFSTPAERAENGEVWKRRDPRAFCPVLTLDAQGKLAAVAPR